MIEVKNLSKKFGKLSALQQVSVNCNQGECIALIGPNGSGKTTLIKTILGLVVPSSGQILFNGTNISNDWKYRKYIGYMPQNGRYPENMSIGQVLNMMKDIRRSDSTNYDEELIYKYEIDTILNKRMGTLSGGTRQKVSACLTFLFDAIVFILDEPTAGLDPVSSEILKDKIIKERQKGKLILITSHILSELDDIVSEIIYMQEGRMVFHKPIAQLRNETNEQKLSKAIAKIILQKRTND